jgi:hypothetical protein
MQRYETSSYGNYENLRKYENLMKNCANLGTVLKSYEKQMTT